MPAYFTSLSQFITSVTDRLTKPRRGVGGSEGVLISDLLEALIDTGKYANDAKEKSEQAIAAFNVIYDPALSAANNAAASAIAAAAMVQGAATTRPSIRPRMLWDFANTKALDPRMSFTRAMTPSTGLASYINEKGLIAYAVQNEPRFHHNPITGQSLGILTEEQRINAWLRSQEFDNVAWSKSAATIVANAAVAPDGTTTADQLVEDSASAAHYASQNVSFVNGQFAAASCFVKANGRTVAYISIYNGTSSFISYFNLTTGTIISSSATSAKIEDYGNGWFRITAVYLSTVTAAGNAAVGCSITNTMTSQGNGTAGLFLWGGQSEIGNDSTSYIPTTTAAVTRGWDIPLCQGVNLTSWFNQNEGTFYLEGHTPAVVTNTGSVACMASVQDSVNNGNNAYYLLQHNTNNGAGYHRAMFANNGGVLQASLQISTALPASTRLRTSTSFKLNDVRGTVNGGAIQTDSSFTPITADRLLLGSIFGSTQGWNGTIAVFAYYPRAISDTEKQALCSNGLLSGKNSNQLPTAADLAMTAFFPLEALLMLRNRQEFTVEGTGVSRSITIRRPYDFSFALVDSNGSTVTAQPTANCSKDTDYTLTFNAAAGKILTYSITPVFTF